MGRRPRAVDQRHVATSGGLLEMMVELWQRRLAPALFVRVKGDCEVDGSATLSERLKRCSQLQDTRLDAWRQAVGGAAPRRPIVGWASAAAARALASTLTPVGAHSHRRAHLADDVVRPRIAVEELVVNRRVGRKAGRARHAGAERLVAKHERRLVGARRSRPEQLSGRLLWFVVAGDCGRALKQHRHARSVEAAAAAWRTKCCRSARRMRQRRRDHARRGR